MCAPAQQFGCPPLTTSNRSLISPTYSFTYDVACKSACYVTQRKLLSEKRLDSTLCFQPGLQRWTTINRSNDSTAGLVPCNTHKVTTRMFRRLSNNIARQNMVIKDSERLVRRGKISLASDRLEYARSKVYALKLFVSGVIEDALSCTYASGISA